MFRTATAFLFGLTVTTFVFSGLATTAFGQPYPVRSPRNNGFGFGYGNDYGYHSSTAAEGAARGMADLVRSAGYANMQNSEAAKNYQDAYSKALDNRIKNAQTYFEMRRMNKEYRDSMRAPRPTQEQLISLARERAPEPLESHELDSLTGQISWPSLLQDPSFADSTAALDKLFANWANNHNRFSIAEYQEVRSLCNGITAKLKSMVADLPPQQYVAAKNLVEGLSREASQF